MITYPNSKIITIKREEVDGKEGKNKPFLCAYNENIIYAMHDLTPSSFKLYMCLIMNKDGYMQVFSPANLSKMSGMHPDTIRKSFVELMYKKYILPVRGTTAHYEFYEKFQVNDSAPRRGILWDDAPEYYSFKLV